jgi:excisionase family DNA binding protein
MQLDTIALDRWLSPSQAARELGVSVGRVRQLLEEGKLPAIKTALGRLVDGDAVAALAHARKSLHRGASGAQPGR